MWKSMLLLLAFVSIGSAKLLRNAKPVLEIPVLPEELCEEGEYYDSFVEECFKCTHCSNFMYEIKACTESSNAVCGWCGNIQPVEELPENVLISYQTKCMMSSLSFVDMSKLDISTFVGGDDNNDEDENDDSNAIDVEEEEEKEEEEDDDDDDETLEEARIEKSEIKKHGGDSEELDYYDSNEAQLDSAEAEELLRAEIRSYFVSKRSKIEAASKIELKNIEDDGPFFVYPSKDSSEEDDTAKFEKIWIDDRVRRFETQEREAIENEFMRMRKIVRQAEIEENGAIEEEENDCYECEHQKVLHMRFIIIIGCIVIFVIFLRRILRPKVFRPVPLHYIDEKILVESGKNAEKANKYAYDGPEIV